MATDPSSELPIYKRVMLAVLGALALTVLINISRAYFEDAASATAPVLQAHFFHNEATALAAEEELMIDERFPVGEDAALTVRVGDADVQLKVGSTDEIHVEVYLKGEDMEKAKAYFEKQEFEVFEEAGRVYVRTAERIQGNNGWMGNGQAQITVIVHAPEALETEVRTSDGDIAVERVRGTAVFTTSDGDIAAGVLEGPEVALRTSDGDIVAELLDAETVQVTTSDGDIAIERVAGRMTTIRTSDGDIVLKEAQGEVSLTTSDGDIQAGRLDGDAASLRTSDGDIVIELAGAAQTRVTTSDGSIVVREVRGDLEGRTSSGDLSVTLAEVGNLSLKTGDGDITVTAPADGAASLNLRGESIRISSRFNFDGTLEKHEARGDINGGGPRFDIQASSGRVELREN